MAASVLLVQRVAQHFGLAVDRRALALCAVMALIVNFSAILLSVYLTFNHVLMLIIMVIGSAALVTGVNEYLLRREYARVVYAAGGEDRQTDDVEAETEPESPEEEPEKEPEPEPEATEQPPAPEEKVVWEVELPPDVAMPENIPAEETAEPALKQPIPEPADEKPQEIPLPDFLTEKPAPEPEPVFKEPEPEPAVEEPKAIPLPDFLAEEPKPEPVVEEPTPEPEPEPVVEEPTPEPEPEPVVEEPTPEPEPEPIVEEPETEPEKEEPSFTFELPEFSSLDDYLDYAYEEKDAGNTAVAAAAYQKAIDSFPDDPYLPFLVIELGNLYKEAGAYDVAVSTYRDALSLPVIQGQNGIVDEFKKNIAYLEAVSHITSRHDAPETPFSQIPPDWLAEIEEAFAKQAEH